MFSVVAADPLLISLFTRNLLSFSFSLCFGGLSLLFSHLFAILLSRDFCNGNFVEVGGKRGDRTKVNFILFHIISWTCGMFKHPKLWSKQVFKTALKTFLFWKDPGNTKVNQLQCVKVIPHLLPYPETKSLVISKTERLKRSSSSSNGHSHFGNWASPSNCYPSKKIQNGPSPSFWEDHRRHTYRETKSSTHKEPPVSSVTGVLVIVFHLGMTHGQGASTTTWHRPPTSEPN